MSCFVLYLYIEKGQMERLLAGFINQADMESDEDDNPVPVKNKAVNVQLPGSQTRPHHCLVFGNLLTVVPTGWANRTHLSYD